MKFTIERLFQAELILLDTEYKDGELEETYYKTQRHILFCRASECGVKLTDTNHKGDNK